jgi:hypothetical protein
VLAPGIKRVRETASFGMEGKDREEIINLVTLLAVRNPRTRDDMQRIYTEIFRAVLAAPFEDKAKWDAVVEAMKAAGKWPEDEPSDFEGYKKPFWVRTPCCWSRPDAGPFASCTCAISRRALPHLAWRPGK